MASETPKATDVIWINLDEYYYVCDSCSESWRGMSWFPLTSFANNWEERNKPIYEELEGSDRPCDLCRYDIDEFVQEVIDRNLDPEEIPEVIKGDVLERIKKLEQTLGGRETDVLDNYSKDEIPKSLHERQLEFSKNLTGFWLEKKIEEILDILQLISESQKNFELLLAKRISEMYVDYELAVKNDLWHQSTSTFVESVFSFPGSGFLFTAVDELLREWKKSKRTEKGAKNLLDNIHRIEKELGEDIRDPLEGILEGSDRQIGEFFLLILASNHERMKYNKF